jgi:hypothetical protein
MEKALSWTTHVMNISIDVNDDHDLNELFHFGAVLSFLTYDNKL